jgi:hypothetical protein
VVDKLKEKNQVLNDLRSREAQLAEANVEWWEPGNNLGHWVVLNYCVYWFCCAWRTTSPSRDCWVSAIAMEPTSLSSKTPESGDINPLNASWSCSRSQGPLVPLCHLPSSPSIPSTVLLARPSGMGWPDALPSDWAQQILGLCWRNYLPSRTSRPI